MRSIMLWFLSGSAGMWLMELLRLTGPKRCVCVLTLLNVAKLGKAYLYRYTVEEMRMTITTTPATTPTTMATVWSSGSSVGGSTTEKEIRAPSVKANHTVNRQFFPNPCLSAWFLLCSLMNVAFWSGVRPRSCMLYRALLSCLLAPLWVLITAQKWRASSVFSIMSPIFENGVCNADSEIQNSFITYPFSLAACSCVQFWTFTVEVERGAVASFRANSIILTRIWHTWPT